MGWIKKHTHTHTHRVGSKIHGFHFEHIFEEKIRGGEGGGGGGGEFLYMIIYVYIHTFSSFTVKSCTWALLTASCSRKDFISLFSADPVLILAVNVFSFSSFTLASYKRNLF